jgi:hypothetical protein
MKFGRKPAEVRMHLYLGYKTPDISVRVQRYYGEVKVLNMRYWRQQGEVLVPRGMYCKFTGACVVPICAVVV